MLSTDIKYYLSGGVANTNPNLSLGGAISNTEVSSTLNGLFDVVSPEEASDGDIEYRCIWVKNNNITETLYNAYLYISSETTSIDTSVKLAYDSAGLQTIINENTAPSSPALTFSAATTKLTGTAIGNLAPGIAKMIWLQWTVTAGASKLNSDAGALVITGGITT